MASPAQPTLEGVMVNAKIVTVALSAAAASGLATAAVVGSGPEPPELGDPVRFRAPVTASPAATGTGPPASPAGLRSATPVAPTPGAVDEDDDVDDSDDDDRKRGRGGTNDRGSDDHGGDDSGREGDDD
ncbi:MAG: hypothetical protein ACRDYU_08890 [Actinomycetes bacterium]